VAEKDEARAEGGRTGPVSCGGIAEGYVQFNGGFVTREPTCATLVVRVDGAEGGRAARRSLTWRPTTPIS